MRISLVSYIHQETTELRIFLLDLRGQNSGPSAGPLDLRAIALNCFIIARLTP